MLKITGQKTAECMFPSFFPFSSLLNAVEPKRTGNKELKLKESNANGRTFRDRIFENGFFGKTSAEKKLLKLLPLEN